MKTKEKEYIYFRESALQSAISDSFMFVMLGGAMAVNHYYLGDSSVWAVFLFGMVLVAMAGGVKRRNEVFTSKEELRKFINETL